MFSHLGGVLVAMAPTGMPRIVPNQFYIFKLPLEPLLQLLYLMHHWQHSKPTCTLGAGRHCRFVMAVVHQNRRGGHWILQESSTFFLELGFGMIWDMETPMPKAEGQLPSSWPHSAWPVPKNGQGEMTLEQGQLQTPQPAECSLVQTSLRQ